MSSVETIVNAPLPSESDTWVMEPCDDWPAYHYGDSTLRLLNAIPDEYLPRCRQRAEQHHEEMETEENDASSTSYDVVEDQSSFRHLLLLPVNLMCRLWARLWTKRPEQDNGDDDVSAEMETLSTAGESEAPAAARTVLRSRAAQTAAIAAAAEVDLRSRVNSQPPIIATSSASFRTSSQLTDDGVPFRSVRASDIRSLAEELKLRLAAVSPSIVESHVDSETGLIHYVNEDETADIARVTGGLRRLVPRYRPDELTGKLEIDCYITVQAVA